MATNFSVHEKIWFDKFKYDIAERRFYEQMNGPVASTSRQENGPRVSSGPNGEHSELVVLIASLEVENQSLRSVMQELQQAMSKLEAQLNVLEKSSAGHWATVPQTQHVSPMCQVEPRPRSQPHQQRMTRKMTLTFLAATMRRRTRRQHSCGRNGCRFPQ
uniref:Elongation factor 1-delta n=1 Tax=Gorilla gorilla gorilla TaxID=9595 RepID=A0A2I2YT60_GORGO